MRFKLLRGTFVRGSVPGKAGKKLQVKFRRGDVIESDVDLVKTQGSVRFERVADDTPLSEGATATAAPPPPDVVTDGDSLDDMTVQELRKYAEDSEVDLGAARTKAEIIAVIRDTV